MLGCAAVVSVHAVCAPAVGPAAVMAAGAFPPCVLSAQESHSLAAVVAVAVCLRLCCRPAGAEA